MNKAVDEILGPQAMGQIVDEATIIVRRRTLLGFGVAADGSRRQKLKKLADSYIEQRAGKAVYFTDKQGRVRRIPTSSRFRSRLKLSPKTTPGKSNLTLTGQLLDSLRGFVTGPGRGEIRPVGLRSDGLSNEDVARFVDEAGRPFLHLSDNEIKQLEIFAGELFEALLRKNLTKVN